MDHHIEAPAGLDEASAAPQATSGIVPEPLAGAPSMDDTAISQDAQVTTRLTDTTQLVELFRAAEKPASRFRIGVEAEKFGLSASDHAPMPYEGERGVQQVLHWLERTYGWRPVRETPTGPLIALQRAQASITLEPGAQLELSGAPHDTVHQAADEWREHLLELARIEQQFGIWFAHIGFQPFARATELPWVPKRRYPIMREYLPTRGVRARDMMQRTCTVQVNLDYESEHDAMQKLLVLLRLTPLIQALTSNSPFVEGVRGPRRSERLDVWMHMDPARSGLIQKLWARDRLGYADYVEWALDAGMFLFVRNEQLVLNTGQTFREFMQRGFDGFYPQAADWKQHLATLFPEVRLKSTLEARGCDALPPDLAMSVPALLAGITYDATALDQAAELAEKVRVETALSLQREIAVEGLAARLDGTPIKDACLHLLGIAEGGLRRRGRLDGAGRDESIYLVPLRALAEQGKTPADRLLDEVAQRGSIEAALRAQAAAPVPWS